MKALTVLKIVVSVGLAAAIASLFGSGGVPLPPPQSNEVAPDVSGDR